MSANYQAHLKLNTRLAPALVGLLLGLQLVIPFRGWVILLVGLGGGWLLSYLWARSLQRQLRLRREVRFGWAQVGDRLEERFTLVNYGLAPALWVEVIDHSTMPNYQAGLVTGVGGNARNQWQTQGICTRRGLYTLGPTTLQTGDPFGLYTVTLHYPNFATLTVTPPVVPLPAIEVAPGGRVGEGRPRANPMERTVSSAVVRSYLPGDALNWIHWRTSARHNSLYVRLFDNTPAGDWWIFVDLDHQVQVGEAETSTEEHAVILAASLADRGLHGGRAVGLVTHGQELVWLPPQAGAGQRQNILQALAVVHPGPCSLAKLLSRVHPASGHIASLVIITPAVGRAWVEALLPLLRRGVVATVLLLDPLSFGGQGDSSGVLALLTDLGVKHYRITPELLNRPEARPGQQGDWQWRVTSTGRAIAVRRPDNVRWRALT